MSLDSLAKTFRSQIDDFNARYSYDEVSIRPIQVEQVDERNYNDSFVQAKDIWIDAKAKLDTNEFYAVSIVGTQGSGKTNLGSEFAICAMEDRYRLIYALPEDFLNNVEGWIDAIKEQDDVIDRESYDKGQYCIMLDDLSYSNDQQNRKNQSLLKNAIARIRHRLEGKVFLIYITHRLHAAPPMLRNSGSWIFSEMQSADRDDALEVIGKNKELREKLDQIYSWLQGVIFEGAKSGIVKYELDGKRFTFKWGKKSDAGNGRLMCLYHAAQLVIYNSKLIPYEFNLNDFRVKALEKIEEKK